MGLVIRVQRSSLFLQHNWLVYIQTGNPSEALSFAIGDTSFDNVQSAEYLGVILDQHLVWDEHIKLLQTKISRSLSFLEYAKKIPTAGNFKPYI